jgi:hypothetical protein
LRLAAWFSVYQAGAAVRLGERDRHLTQKGTIGCVVIRTGDRHR